MDRIQGRGGTLGLALFLLGRTWVSAPTRGRKMSVRGWKAYTSIGADSS